MATIDELNQLVTDLQASIDAKQQQIADAIAAFEKTIADLTAQIIQVQQHQNNFKQ